MVYNKLTRIIVSGLGKSTAKKFCTIGKYYPLNKEAYKLTLKNALKIKLFLKNLELLICVLNVKLNCHSDLS